MGSPTTLYRLYSAAGGLLYVGIAGNPGRRFNEHAHDKRWWDQVARVDLRHFPTREQALAAEEEAIRTERPAHNVVHNAGPSAPPRAPIHTEYRTDSLPAFTPTSLVGSYFHGDADNQVQGIVVAEPVPGWYLCEFFSWTHGGSNNQKLVQIEAMCTWRFYDTDSWMRTEYEYRVSAQWERERNPVAHPDPPRVLDLSELLQQADALHGSLTRADRPKGEPWDLEDGEGPGSIREDGEPPSPYSDHVQTGAQFILDGQGDDGQD